MRKTILLALLSMFLVGCANKPIAWTPANVKLDGEEESPIDLPARGMPIVTLARSTANDDAKVVATIALIDTGAAHSKVSAKYAEKHKLDVRKIGGVRVARIDSIKIGQASLDDFDAVVEDFKSNPGLGDKLDFVLGRSVFADVLLTIDYTHHRMTIARGALPPPNTQGILPMKRNDAGDLLIPITIDNRETWVILDTAHTGVGLTLAAARAGEINWAAPTIEGESVSALLDLPPSRIGRIAGEIRIGPWMAESPIVAISRADAGDRIGAELLRHFIVTIDQKNNRVRFDRTSTKPIDTPALRRLGFNFTDDKGKIEVIPNTGAHAAGLLDGDRIISIDGIPLERFKYQQRDAVERNQTSVMVRFERDGQEKIARMQLTTIVN